MVKRRVLLDLYLERIAGSCLIYPWNRGVYYANYQHLKWHMQALFSKLSLYWGEIVRLVWRGLQSEKARILRQSHPSWDRALSNVRFFMFIFNPANIHRQNANYKAHNAENLELRASVDDIDSNEDRSKGVMALLFNALLCDEEDEVDPFEVDSEINEVFQNVVVPLPKPVDNSLLPSHPDLDGRVDWNATTEDGADNQGVEPVEPDQRPEGSDAGSASQTQQPGNRRGRGFGREQRPLRYGEARIHQREGPSVGQQGRIGRGQRRGQGQQQGGGTDVGGGQRPFQHGHNQQGGGQGQGQMASPVLPAQHGIDHLSSPPTVSPAFVHPPAGFYQPGGGMNTRQHDSPQGVHHNAFVGGQGAPIGQEQGNVYPEVILSQTIQNVPFTYPPQQAQPQPHTAPPAYDPFRTPFYTPLVVRNGLPSYQVGYGNNPFIGHRFPNGYMPVMGIDPYYPVGMHQAYHEGYLRPGGPRY